MNGLLWLLLWGAFFYFMMRFGCGAHMVHGDHGEHEGHAGHGTGSGQGMDMGGNTTKDPVCGMEVPAGQGYSKMLNGREYRFDSRKCLDQFEADPTRYISRERS